MCNRHSCSHDESPENYAEVEPKEADEDASPSLPLSRRGMLAATGGTLGVLGASGAASAHEPWELNPHAHEYDPAHGNNYTDSSRRSGDINWIVPHVTAGSFSSAVNWFKDPDNTYNSSAHYVIRNSDGYCKQMVLDEDLAHHAAGFNSLSIGIEHEWYDGQGGLSEANLDRSAAIARHIADENDIPLEYYTDPCVAKDAGGGFVGHTDAPKNWTCDSSDKSCPYPPWDWTRYMRKLYKAGGEVVPQGHFMLQNEHSGKVMEVEAGSHDNGTNIQQWDWTGAHHQQWYLDYVGNGMYRLVARHSDKVAEVAGESRDNGGNIQQWEWWGGNNQRWFLVPTGADWRIVNVHAMKAIEVGGWSTANGGNISQYEWLRQSNQVFKLNPV